MPWFKPCLCCLHCFHHSLLVVIRVLCCGDGYATHGNMVLLSLHWKFIYGADISSPNMRQLTGLASAFLATLLDKCVDKLIGSGSGILAVCDRNGIALVCTVCYLMHFLKFVLTTTEILFSTWDQFLGTRPWIQKMYCYQET